MRILITGFTAKQAEELPTFKFAQLSSTIRDQLKSMGHDVDLRVVVPGEDLTAYDKVLVYLFAPGSYCSVHQYGALWALSQRPDAVYVLDDWQVKGIQAEAKKLVLRGPTKTGLFKPVENVSHAGAARDNALALMGALRELAGDGTWRRKMLLPMFRRGRVQDVPFPTVRQAVVVDPSLIWLRRYGELAEKLDKDHRARVWVHAALARETDWINAQKFTWPVDDYGDKTKPGNRVHEVDLVPILCRSWGLLSVPHPNPSLGWWRVRFAMAAACKTVVLGSALELEAAYGTQACWASRQTVEQLNDAQLAELADRQGQALRLNIMSDDEICVQLNEVLS